MSSTINAQGVSCAIVRRSIDIVRDVVSTTRNNKSSELNSSPPDVFDSMSTTYFFCFRLWVGLTNTRQHDVQGPHHLSLAFLRTSTQFLFTTLPQHLQVQPLFCSRRNLFLLRVLPQINFTIEVFAGDAVFLVSQQFFQLRDCFCQVCVYVFFWTFTDEWWHFFLEFGKFRIKYLSSLIHFGCFSVLRQRWLLWHRCMETKEPNWRLRVDKTTIPLSFGLEIGMRLRKKKHTHNQCSRYL